MDSSYIFDKSALDKQLKKAKGIHCVMGVSCDGKISSYCLIRSDKFVILAKSMTDHKLFKEEVENLSKYFNAITVYQ